MITQDQILKQLREIIDPELNINIVDLGLIYDLVIDQEKGGVEIVMTLTNPGCPLSIVFEEWVPEAAKRVAGVKNARVTLVWEPPWDPDRISDEAKEKLGIIR